MKLILDLETNSLLHEYQLREVGAEKVLDKVWCICFIDVDTGREFVFIPNESYKNHTEPYTVSEKVQCYYDSKALNDLLISSDIECLIGHDIQAFDLPVLEKIYGITPTCRVFDTKIAARVIYPDTKTDDWRSRITGEPWGEVPNSLSGSHTLKAWGLRLGVHKGDRTTQDFSRFSQEMLDYCMQDCRVTLALYKKLSEANFDPRCLELEHKFSKIIDQQKLNGFTFDIKKAEDLTATLQKERIRLEDELKNLFPPRVVEFETPKKRLKRTKTIIFNPASRDHISFNLINKYGWKPVKFCEKTGKPQVDEDVLSELDYPEAKRLVEYLTIQKRLGQLCEGKQAWLSLVQSDGKIHGGVNTNGTVTGRCSHVAPNMGQVPRVGNPYGAECRELFTADPGEVLIGTDAKGIQLRALGHYLARYDGGEYATLVVSGDPHERNRVEAGIATRDEAKTFIYAFLFGAGGAKIGKILGRTAEEGRRIIQRFLRGVPAIACLRRDIERAIKERGSLRGLDGRLFPIRSEYLGLNVLLMGFEAVIMKQAVINVHDLLSKEGLQHGRDYKQVAMVHDEYQFTAPESIAGVVQQASIRAIELAGAMFNSRCPLSAESKIGRNWKETH